jgi:hypothetical protein
MNTSSPLFPIPKIWIPAVVAIVAILISGIATGEFGTAEVAALITTAGYFVLGYSLPGGPTGGGGSRPRGEASVGGRDPAQY